MTTPFYRVQGSGTTAVVCLHSNASSSSQWRALGELLQDRYKVIALDGYGAGKSPEWAGPAPVRLADEVALASAVFAEAGERFHVVGHSYGGAVALKLALLQPQRVRSLVLYEPTFFSFVNGDDPARGPAGGIWNAATDAAAAAESGDLRAAAERFIDFWMGAGAWAAMPPARQEAVAASVRHVGAWRDALTNEPAPRDVFAALEMPILCLWGEESPESSLAVVRALLDVLPNATAAAQRGIGHMGPITHAEIVNAQIAAFLDRH